MIKKISSLILIIAMVLSVIPSVYAESAHQVAEAAYGTPTTESSTSLTYDKGNTRLRFSLRDGKVSGISYVLL